MYLIPFLVVLSACSISVYSLYSRATRLDPRFATASISIVLFGFVYILCHVSYTIILIRHTVLGEKEGYFGWSARFCQVAMVLGEALNVGLNPLLYIWRMDKLRAYVLRGCKLEETSANRGIAEITRFILRVTTRPLQGSSNANSTVLSRPGGI